MVLAALAWESSSGRRIAGIAVESVPQDRERFAPFIAKVTAAGNCRWTDPNFAIENGADVRLGQTFALESGRLEVTYYSFGTKLILEGPVVYKADAPNSGLLEIGKLTFYAAGSRPAAATGKAPTRHAPNAKFCIRTPNVGGSNKVIIDQSDGVLMVDKEGGVFWHALSPTVIGTDLNLTPMPGLGLVVGADKTRKLVVVIEKSRIRSPTAAEASEAASTCAKRHWARRGRLPTGKRADSDTLKMRRKHHHARPMTNRGKQDFRTSTRVAQFQLHLEEIVQCSIVPEWSYPRCRSLWV